MTIRPIQTATATMLAGLLLAFPAQAKDRSALALAQSPETWITTDDYPAAALSANAEGVTAVKWDISAAGRAENCVVTAPSGSADLDEAACRLIVERARYTPALDRKGKPARSSATRRVRWQIPVAQPDTVVPYTLKPF